LSRRAVFLDRDGTLNIDVGYPHRPGDLELVEGVIPGLRRLTELGFALVITTNQSGIARGYFSEADMHAFNHALVARLAEHGITIAGIYFCPFHPTEGIGTYRRESPLRKPQPGMILLAAAEHDLDVSSSFAIGDRMTDIAAGHAAGCRAILVRTGEADKGAPSLTSPPDYVADDLSDAAIYIQRAVQERTDVP